MTTKRDFIDYKLAKAEDALKAAALLYENSLMADAVSKVYYAAFYIVSALLTNLELNPKSHSGAKSLFHKEFIYTGIIDKEFGKLYDTLMAKRFEADYESFALIDEEDLPNYLEQVKLLYQKAQEILRLQ